MNPFDVRRQLAALNLPGGVSINAEALILDYDYPLWSAVERATEWHENSLRIQALGH